MTTVTEEPLYTTVPSPIGELLLVGDAEVLRRVRIEPGRGSWSIGHDWRRADDAFEQARGQLDEYFAGDRTEFDLAIEASGPEWERRVWAELGRIPYGRTVSYGEIARAIGAPDAARAVGAANGRNPLAIVIPCHRVIGADGSLTGYGGGLDRKRFLLELEGSILAV